MDDSDTYSSKYNIVMCWHKSIKHSGTTKQKEECCQGIQGQLHREGDLRVVKDEFELTIQKRVKWYSIKWR